MTNPLLKFLNSLLPSSVLSSLPAGNVLQVGPSGFVLAPVNLAGGSNAVSGVLPPEDVPPVSQIGGAKLGYDPATNPIKNGQVIGYMPDPANPGSYVIANVPVPPVSEIGGAKLGYSPASNPILPGQVIGYLPDPANHGNVVIANMPVPPVSQIGGAKLGYDPATNPIKDGQVIGYLPDPANAGSYVIANVDVPAAPVSQIGGAKLGYDPATNPILPGQVIGYLPDPANAGSYVIANVSISPVSEIGGAKLGYNPTTNPIKDGQVIGYLPDPANPGSYVIANVSLPPVNQVGGYQVQVNPPGSPAPPLPGDTLCFVSNASGDLSLTNIPAPPHKKHVHVIGYADCTAVAHTSGNPANPALPWTEYVYTVQATDECIVQTVKPISYMLPAAASSVGREITIKDGSAALAAAKMGAAAPAAYVFQAVTTAPDRVDGGSFVQATSASQAITLLSDGASGWWGVAKF
jgi:hypothetical protein